MSGAVSRSVSLPCANPNFIISSRAREAYHVRSASLPSRSHPLVSQLEGEVRAARAWLAAEPEIITGLIRLERLLQASDDLLHLPQTSEGLRRNYRGSSALADDFLIFADAYGSFRCALISLLELQSAAQVAIRRRDEACLTSSTRSLRKVSKEVANLVSTLRNVSTGSALESAFAGAASNGGSAADVELSGIVGEVMRVSISVSTAVFQETAAVLASVPASLLAPKSSSWRTLRKRLALTSSSKKSTEDLRDWAKRASEKMNHIEGLVAALGSGSESLFRRLMNTRVFLLNTLTP